MRATLWLLGIAGFLLFSTYAYKEVNKSETKHLSSQVASLTEDRTALIKERNGLLRRVTSHKKAIVSLREDCQLPSEEPDQTMAETEIDQSVDEGSTDVSADDDRTVS